MKSHMKISAVLVLFMLGFVSIVLSQSLASQTVVKNGTTQDSLHVKTVSTITQDTIYVVDTVFADTIYVDDESPVRYMPRTSVNLMLCSYTLGCRDRYSPYDRYDYWGAYRPYYQSYRYPRPIVLPYIPPPTRQYTPPRRTVTRPQPVRRDPAPTRRPTVQPRTPTRQPTAQPTKQTPTGSRARPRQPIDNS